MPSKLKETMMQGGMHAVLVPATSEHLYLARC
jgi:hypothetical protein